MPVFTPGRDSAVKLGGMTAAMIGADPEFFAAVGMQIRRGRAFTPEDRAGAPPVAVINETMAHTLWPGESALGKCIIPAKRGNPCHTVVGVSQDAHRFQMIEKPGLEYFLPIDQMPVQNRSPTNIIVRAQPGVASTVAARLRGDMVRLLPAAQSVWAVRLKDKLAPQLRPWRLGAALFTSLGLLALLVAAVGTYSTVAFSFGQRTRELGVRIALGAQRGDVVRLVFGEGLSIVAVGVAVGLLLAIALARLVASQVYGVSARDPGVLGVAAILVLSIGVIASIAPAWRAMRVNPVEALRAD
jgi:hypothetical protein